MANTENTKRARRHFVAPAHVARGSFNAPASYTREQCATLAQEALRLDSPPEIKFVEQ